MQEGAVRFEEMASARGALELAPGTAAGMTVSAQVAKPEPASIRAVGMGTEVHGGVDLTWTAGGRRALDQVAQAAAVEDAWRRVHRRHKRVCGSDLQTA